MYSKTSRTYIENKDNTYSLIYGVKNPTSDQLEVIYQKKINYCNNLLLPNFSKHFTDLNKRTVLEFGSGQGIMARYMSSMFKRYICMDVCKNFLQQCAQHTEESTNIEYELVDDYYFSSNKIQKESIDIITSSHVFCHCNYYQFIIYLEKFYEYLKDGGILFFDIYNSDALSWDNATIVEHKNNFKDSFTLEFLFNPISNKIVKRELKRMGLVEVYDSSYDSPSTGWNLLGFKKVSKII